MRSKWKQLITTTQAFMQKQKHEHNESGTMKENIVKLSIGTK